MQTSIASWFKKSSAVKQSITPSPTTETPISRIQPTPSDGQDASTLSSPSQQPTPQPTLTVQPKPTTTSTTTSTPTLPFSHPEKGLVKNITLVPCDSTNISSFERLNTLLLPIPYPRTFYKETLSDPISSSLTLLALWHDNPSSAATTPGKVVAAIRCRILPSPASSLDDDKILYISTLGVLSPFRSYGIATHLLGVMIERGIRMYGVSAVGAHVWEAGQEAREWYAKRGFKEIKLEEGYYRRLTPQGAYVLRREIGPRDLLDHGGV
ncbi:hypothetical protein E4T39_04100 [Aureobasidium subglaciale]|nr:hypothetical protein E4T39_04100 [Aureobasidium subglaciale]